MTTPLRPATSAHRTPKKALALAATGLLVASMGFVVAAPAAAADATFATSFEDADVQPDLATPVGAPSNFTGDRFSVGSLLGLVDEVIATGSSPNSEGPANLADGVSSSKWLVFDDVGTVTYTLSEPAAITSYALTSANDSPDRDPRNFTVEGSNDGENWTEIDSQEGQQWQEGSNQNRFVTKTYDLDERSGEYSYYRLDVTENNGTNIVQLADWELIDAERGQVISPMALDVTGGPSSSHTAKTGVGFTGVKSLEYSGQVVDAGDASATSLLYDVDVDVAADSQLSYKIFPVLDSDVTYSSTHVAVDLRFTDGSLLSATDATDAYGYGISARDQGEGNILWPDQWNSVTVDLGALAGKTIDAVLLSYNQADAAAGTPVLGYLDDVAIEAATVRDTSDGYVSYVDTRRGTNSTGGFSRGNNLPAAAWPNGFNFITPMSTANGHGTIYQYQRENDANNLPGLAGIGFSHQPSIWMGDRNQLAVLPAPGDNPSSSLNERRLAFRHENEVARPDIYSVEFENGITTAVTPTDHGALYRFTFDTDEGSVLVDQLENSSKLAVSADGAVSGWVDNGSGYPGRTRMFVAGQFDATPIGAGATTRGNRNGSARYAAFDTSSDNTIELRIASSFISQDQAQRNLDFEVTGRTFEEVHSDVTAAWNDRLSVIRDVDGATDEQLVNLYSGLYRLNLYPNSQFENTGTEADPVYQYASPVAPTVGNATDTETNAVITDGKIYVNNGFWDTYRTAWPLYALLYPDLTEELVDGFVQQYRDGGWVARWSSPGYADLMTGTSSDVAFAEAYMAGALSTDLALEAYDAALKNATALPESNAVGRKGLDRSIFLGFTHAGTHESASWGLEGFINDFGIAQMAAALADDPATPAARVDQLREEAAYFETRAGHYAEMYNPQAGVFTARNADGSWPEGADFNKMAWGGAFTEASGWTFSFHAPHDVDGMAALYGGRDGLLNELDEFLTTQERAEYSGIHEAREARDVRLGMLGMSNQVAHHIPYVLAEAGDPARAQALIREIQQRLFAGSDIGQGYSGDEDNGEMSAWYIFSALGFYPLEVGSGDYTVGSPLFDSATIDLPGGPLTINAPGASSGDVYVAGLDVNGTAVTSTTFDGSLVRDGGTMTFTMSDSPTTWGAKDLSEELSAPNTHVDVNESLHGTLSAADGTPVSALADDNMRSGVVFDGAEATLLWESAGTPVSIDSYTLTSSGSTGATDPSAWTLEGSSDGQTWIELDSREGQEFPFNTQTRPFKLEEASAGFTQLRLTVNTGDSGDLGLAEIEFFAQPLEGAELSVTPNTIPALRVDEEYAGTLATVLGEEFSAATGTVTVDLGDGSTPVTGNLTPAQLGGWAVSAPHTYDAVGTYPVTVTAVDTTGASASTTISISVSRDNTLVGSFNNQCIGDLNEVAANCDDQGYGYFRDHLQADGFVQGEIIELAGTDLAYALPDVAPGQPDNVTGEGQTISIDLGAGASMISFIGAATESAKDLTGVITFSDGSTQTVPIQFGDWVGASGNPAFGNTVVAVSNGRTSGTGAESSVKRTAMYATAPVALDTDGAGEPKTAVSLTLPEEEGTLRANGRMHLFAIASDGDLAAIEAFSVTAEDVPPVTVGTEFQADLAAMAGPANGASATINWGDGSPVIPAEVADGVISGTHTYAAPGDYTVVVTADNGVTSAAADVQIEATAYAPVLTVTPKTVRPGQTVNVDGTGFAPTEQVTVTFADSAGQTVAADEAGDIIATVSIPQDATDGDYPITALGAQSAVLAQATVRVEAVAPVPVTTSTTLESTTSDAIVGEPVQLVATVSPESAVGSVEIVSDDSVVGTATVSGGIATVDVRPATSGAHVYTARFIPDNADAYSASMSSPLTIEVRSMPVLEPELRLSASEVEQGGQFTVSGFGFAANETVRIELHSEPMSLGTARADAAGAFSADVTVAADAPVGEHTVVVTGTASELAAQASLTVTAASDGAQQPDGADGDGDGATGADQEGLSTTGPSVNWLIAFAGALLLIGAVVLVVRRRMWAATE